MNPPCFFSVLVFYYHGVDNINFIFLVSFIFFVTLDNYIQLQKCMVSGVLTAKNIFNMFFDMYIFSKRVFSGQYLLIRKFLNIN